MSNNVKEHKRAVALVLYDKDRYDQGRYDKDRYDKARRHLLVVKRPPEDERLPNVWGLPAATLRVGESYEDAAVRAGQEKLGVKIKIVGKIAEGTADRGDHILRMKEFEVEIADGTPSVPQSIAQPGAQPITQPSARPSAQPIARPSEGVTQYVAWQMGRAG